MISDYFYDEQIRRYLLQFANIFVGLTIKTGRGADGQTTMIPVPIHYGSVDRTVAYIYSRNTQVAKLPIPMMSFYMAGLDLAPDRRKGIHEMDRRTYLPVGGVFPDDLKTIRRAVPIPYNMNVDLHLYVSNTQQLHQILEQILILFDPTLQIQTTDAPFDWTALTSVELVGMSNEENYPQSTESRAIIWTLSFVIPIWLTPPADIKTSYIDTIKLRITADPANLHIYEFGPNGEPLPFSNIDEEIDITWDGQDPPQPINTVEWKRGS